MKPGQAPICQTCRHFHPESWEMGHPTPCGRVRWEDQRHVEPTLAADGRSCEDYEREPDTGGPEPDSLAEAFEATEDQP